MENLLRALEGKSNFGWAVIGLLIAIIPLGSFFHQVLGLGEKFSNISDQIPLVIMTLCVGLLILGVNLWKFVKANEP